jgi:2-C-methyl-D-erythritol 4-phosphate cytidylyltransferase
VNWAVIVAAGRGRRMGGAVRKQFLPLGGMSILGCTLQTFVVSSLFTEILVVVAGEDLEGCEADVVAPLEASVPVRLVAGGSERQESVFNGLRACPGSDDDLVVIHDGVRPLVPPELIANCLETAAVEGAAIVALPSSDTLKQGLPDGRIAQTLAREGVWQAQTPQAFRLGLIREAHRCARREGFTGTDDAQLVERMHQPVFLIPGLRSNIKITHPDDLVLAQAIYQRRHAAAR